jgi:hypothetical protein
MHVSPRKEATKGQASWESRQARSRHSTAIDISDNADIQQKEKRMFHTRLMRSVLVPLATVVAIGATMVSVPSRVSAADQVPFRATLTETAGPVALCPADQTRYICVTVLGTGHATHLGAITESMVVRVDTSGGAGGVSGCPPEVRTSTLTAANGDQITLQGPGQACGPMVGIAIAHDSWTVIAGTGRFASTIGDGTNIATITRPLPPAQTTSVTIFTGTISPPGQ